MRRRIALKKIAEIFPEGVLRLFCMQRAGKPEKYTSNPVCRRGSGSCCLRPPRMPVAPAILLWYNMHRIDLLDDHEKIT